MGRRDCESTSLTQSIFNYNATALKFMPLAFLTTRQLSRVYLGRKYQNSVSISVFFHKTNGCLVSLPSAFLLLGNTVHTRKTKKKREVKKCKIEKAQKISVRSNLHVSIKCARAYEQGLLSMRPPETHFGDQLPPRILALSYVKPL